MYLSCETVTIPSVENTQNVQSPYEVERENKQTNNVQKQKNTAECC